MGIDILITLQVESGFMEELITLKMKSEYTGRVVEVPLEPNQEYSIKKVIFRSENKELALLITDTIEGDFLSITLEDVEIMLESEDLDQETKEELEELQKKMEEDVLYDISISY